MRISRLGFCSFVTAIVACSAGRSSGGDGSAEVIAVTSSALTQADVAGVALTISGAGIDPTITTSLARVGSKFQGIIGGIPAGANRTFHGEGDDANGGQLYAGDATGVTITKGQQALIALILQQQQKPSPFENSAPQITAVQASSSNVAPGDSIGLNATATDPDGDTLTYTWSATDGAFTNGTQSNATWTAPATPGKQTLTLRVRDPKGASAAVSFDVQVSAAAGTGSASVAASFNDAPSVSAITIDENPLQVGAVATLGVTVTDLDQDAIASYDWTSTCDGTFSGATSAAPTFTLSDGNASSCAFTVKVTDARGGWNTGTLSVATGVAPSIASPPTIDATFQSSDTADGGQTVVFRVKAHDSDGTAVSYAWTSSDGAVTLPTTDADGNSVYTWTAPACLTGDEHVSVAITNAAGASTTQTFTVTPSANQTCRTTLSPEAVDLTATDALASVAGLDSSGMSDDGTLVYFISNDPTLPGLNAQNQGLFSQVFLRDRSKGQITLISTNGSVAANGDNTSLSVSSDGRIAVFQSTAPNLSSNQTGAPSWYMWDRLAFVFPVVGHALPLLLNAPNVPNGQLPPITNVKVSGDGSTYCFSAPSAILGPNAPPAVSIFTASVYGPGQPTLVSTGHANETARYCSISQDGKKVSFSTTEGIDASDDNNATDIYVRDLTVIPADFKRVPPRVGVTTEAQHVLSRDGTHVGFRAGDTYYNYDFTKNLTSYDATVTAPSVVATSMSISADGKYFAYVGSGYQAYVSTFGLSTVLQSVGPGGNPVEGTFPVLSGDGSFISFVSTTLLTGGTDANVPHLYIQSRREN